MAELHVRSNRNSSGRFNKLDGKKDTEYIRRLNEDDRRSETRRVYFFNVL